MDLEIPRSLAKFLADARMGSKAQIEALAQRGSLQLNGESTGDLRQLIDPQDDVMEVDGQRARLSPPTFYALLNKPGGVVTTLSDPTGKRCVAGLLPEDWLGRVGVVGRLDKPTTGALLVTDDGDLSHLLTHPDFHVWKRYVLTVRGDPVDADPRLIHLREGVVLGQTRTQPARCGVVPGSGRAGTKHPRLSEVWVEIREGRNRQVRRMASQVQLKLVHLHREAIGPLTLGTLAIGQLRTLSAAEVAALYEAAGGRQAPMVGARRALLRRLSDGVLNDAEAATVRRYLAKTPT